MNFKPLLAQLFPDDQTDLIDNKPFRVRYFMDEELYATHYYDTLERADKEVGERTCNAEGHLRIVIEQKPWDNPTIMKEYQC